MKLYDRKITSPAVTYVGSVPEYLGVREDRTWRGRPKLLLLAYPFPPANLAGCVRTWNIAKHLPLLGWDVTVVTPDPSVWRHVDKPGDVDALCSRLGVRRIFTGHRWRTLAPYYFRCWNEGLGWFIGGVCRNVARRLEIDAAIGWIKDAEQACSPLTANDVDIILASGPPFAAFRLAKRLADRLGCPYVMDYRDPWTGNPHRARPARPATIREEARLLADCAAATIVSPSWASAMDHRFGLGSKLHVVTNGYDAEQLGNVEPYDFGHFAIVYAGNFYPPKRVISPVMAALANLKESINGKMGEWYFHYYGAHENHVRSEAERFHVMEKVKLHGNVLRAEALSALRGAGVAVVITSVSEKSTTEENGIVTGKLFEALGLGIPVMVVSPSGSDVESVIETTGLARIFAASNTDGLVSFLTDVILGRVPKPNNPEIYAWTNIGKRIDAILRGAAAGRICTKSEVLS